jgi:cell division protein FtsB
MAIDFQPSSYNRRESDQHPPPPQQEGWHLDKKVPLSIIFAMLFQMGVAIWAIADIKKDVELLKQDTAALHVRDTQNMDSLKEAMTMVNAQFNRLDAKLDRLIERGTK